MYCDILNLVTTGIGNLIDHGHQTPPDDLSTAQRARLNNEVSARAMQPALNLPWKKKALGWTSKNPLAGELVSPAEVADAWTLVKRQNEVVPDFSQRGGGKYAGLSNLTLDMNGIRDLFNTTLTRFENTLREKNANWDSWPADAQLAMLSMSWAMGPAFTDKFKAMKIALDRGDFASAGAQSYFKGGGDLKDPTSRNAENAIMFKNAADVMKGGVDPNRLFFPGAVATSAGILPSPADVIGPTATSVIGKISKIAVPVIGVAAVGAVGFGLYELGKKKGWL